MLTTKSPLVKYCKYSRARQGPGMKIGLVTGSDLDCVFLVLDETAPECDSASICRAVVLADVNHIQNERHRRIRGLRLAYRKTSAAR